MSTHDPAHMPPDVAALDAAAKARAEAAAAPLRAELDTLRGEIERREAGTPAERYHHDAVPGAPNTPGVRQAETDAGRTTGGGDGVRPWTATPTTPAEPRPCGCTGVNSCEKCIWPPDVDSIADRARAAHDHIAALCKGKRWTMTIPAEPDRDDDLVISAALADIDALLARVRELETKHGDVAGELVDAQMTMWHLEPDGAESDAPLCERIQAHDRRLRESVESLEAQLTLAEDYARDASDRAEHAEHAERAGELAAAPATWALPDSSVRATEQRIVKLLRNLPPPADPFGGQIGGLGPSPEELARTIVELVVLDGWRQVATSPTGTEEQ